MRQTLGTLCPALWERGALGARWAPLRLLADSEVQTNLLGRGWSRKPRPSVSCPGPSGSGLPAAPPEGRGHGDLRLGERAHQARPALGAAGGIRARPPHPQLHPLSAGPCDLGLRCWHGGGRAAGPGEGQAWPRAQGQPGWQDLHPLTPRPAPQATAGAGIVSGFDMTSEAALAKLSYVLGQPGLSLDARKEVRAPAAGGVGEGVPEGGGGWPGPAVGTSPACVWFGKDGGTGLPRLQSPSSWAGPGPFASSRCPGLAQPGAPRMAHPSPRFPGRPETQPALGSEWAEASGALGPRAARAWRLGLARGAWSSGCPGLQDGTEPGSSGPRAALTRAAWPRGGPFPSSCWPGTCGER